MPGIFPTALLSRFRATGEGADGSTETQSTVGGLTMYSVEYRRGRAHYGRQEVGNLEGKKAVTVSTLAQRLHERRAAHRRARALERVLARVPEGTMRNEIIAIAARQS